MRNANLFIIGMVLGTLVGWILAKSITPTAEDIDDIKITCVELAFEISESDGGWAEYVREHGEDAAEAVEICERYGINILPANSPDPAPVLQ